ncbi:hypothetical protein DQ04_23271000, partial [Trypanosoma grayi]|uniref:hypothetical protein n=1 Tax=Trypanosoma grayi TaxID=71804 RepID=UPI0004F481C6
MKRIPTTRAPATTGKSWVPGFQELSGKHWAWGVKSEEKIRTDDLPLSAFSCPTCGFQRHSKHGLTRHRIVSHRFRPDTVKPSQRGQCEGTSMHLLSCPALKSLRCHFGVDGGDMEKLCFMQKLAAYLLAVERFCPQRPSP